MNRLVKYPNGSPFLKSLHSHYGEISMDRRKMRRWIAGKSADGSREKAQMDRGKNFFEKKSFPHPFKKLLFAKPHPAFRRMRL